MDAEELEMMQDVAPMVTPALDVTAAQDFPSVLDPRPVVEYVLEALYEGFAEFSDDLAEFI